MQSAATPLPSPIPKCRAMPKCTAKFAVKLGAALTLLAMLVGAVLITKFYFIDEWAEPETDNRGLKSNCTLVTAFFILGPSPSSANHSRQFDWALSRHHAFLRLLLLLRLPMVVFTDGHSAEFVADVRRSIGMQNATKVWNMSLSELPLQANASLFHSIIEEEQSEGGWRPGWEPALRHRPESRSLDFHILANSKSHFLHNVSTESPFGGSTFVWLDPTYGHGEPSFFPANFQWRPKFPAGKISLLKTSPSNESLHSYPQEELYHRDLNLLSTEFLAGDKPTIDQFHALFQQALLREATVERVFDDDDQPIVVLLAKQNPALFNLAQGQWFNAFHLF